ncbi:MAG: ATP-binding protein [Candidatus Melainabacteria bacterium]|nr:ATP-binding protein [Candidatus Melainabacteria bacterium]
MSKDDKQNLSKALSGFANASGGILIWGVKATEVKDSPDVAQKLMPIKNLKRFITDLNTLSPQLVSPFLENVSHKPILEAGHSDTGYVITFIPEGGNEPHMATGANLQRYYCRTSSTFMKMSHAMVADRFNRIAKPDLRLCFSYLPAGHGMKARIMIGIVNMGLAIARYPAITFGPRFSIPIGQCYLIPWSLDAVPMVSIEMQNGQVFQGREQLVLHPKTMLSFLRWEERLPTDRQAQIFTDFEVFASGYYRKSFAYTRLGDVIDAAPGFKIGKEARRDSIVLAEIEQP